jgi:hypothetical protein
LVVNSRKCFTVEVRKPTIRLDAFRLAGVSWRDVTGTRRNCELDLV